MAVHPSWNPRPTVWLRKIRLGFWLHNSAIQRLRMGKWWHCKRFPHCWKTCIQRNLSHRLWRNRIRDYNHSLCSSSSLTPPNFIPPASCKVWIGIISVWYSQCSSSSCAVRALLIHCITNLNFSSLPRKEQRAKIMYTMYTTAVAEGEKLLDSCGEVKSMEQYFCTSCCAWMCGGQCKWHW